MPDEEQHHTQETIIMTNPEMVAEQHSNGNAVVTSPGQPADPMTVHPKISLQGWADRINAAWDKSLAAILETGRELLAAKRALPHGGWDVLFESQQLRFSRQTAFRLMTIATHPILSNVTHVQHLPPSWGTLYELTKWPDDLLAECLERGLITSETTRTKISDMLTHHCLADPWQSIIVHFRCEEDLQDFAQLIGQHLTADTKSVWYPSRVGKPFEYTPPIKVMHRCECGHVHEDRRTPP